MSESKIIFIIGFPRSGTKLLMQLLKTHPEISGTDFEMNIAHKADMINDLETFKINVSRGTISSKVPENWINELKLSSEPFSFSECFTKFLTVVSSKRDATYYVDKSPRYINHLPLIMRNFPEAKFIHLIRNPVDVALSHENVWNKSIIRTSSHWKIANDKLFSFNNVFRLKYEDITNNTDKITADLSRFLNINNLFDPTKVDSKEKYGYATEIGISKKMRTNSKNLNKTKLIEEFSYSTMKAYGYKPLYAKRERKRSIIHKLLLPFWDKVNVLRFHIREKGLLKGLKYYYSLQF